MPGALPPILAGLRPERFHTERLAQDGVLAGRSAVSRVRLRLVTPDNLRRLAHVAWVLLVGPLRPPAPARLPRRRRTDQLAPPSLDASAGDPPAQAGR
jgi:hypothetical protein